MRGGYRQRGGVQTIAGWGLGRIMAWVLAGSLGGPAAAAPAESKASASAFAPGPVIAAYDQSPTAGIYGLPRARDYRVAEAERWHVGLRVDYTSHYTEQRTSQESLLFDGETTRLGLSFTRGLGSRWQARIELPFVDHSGGFADGFIDDFHDTLGFADGGRSRAPSDRQRFRYRRDGRLALDVDDSPSGLGDIRLGLTKRLADLGGWGSAVGATLKLPTGDADRLTGSGGTDLALWASVGNNADGLSRLRFVAGGGGLYTAEGDVLADQRVPGVAFGWASLGFALTQGFVVSVQSYAHTPFYEDTDLEALDGVAVAGGLGFDWRIGERRRLNFAIIEDLNVGASPDVSFTLGLRQGF